MAWLREDRADLAAERILDAASGLFAEHGVSGTSMDQVAAAAGCSRATLYRYFDSRAALQRAFAHREARIVMERVGSTVGDLTDPTELAVRSVLACLEAIRDRPHLHAWYGGADAALLAEILRESPLIESFATGFTAPADGTADRDLARWVIRAILSFLSVPGEDQAEEERMVRRFLAPHLFPGCGAGQPALPRTRSS